MDVLVINIVIRLYNAETVKSDAVLAWVLTIVRIVQNQCIGEAHVSTTVLAVSVNVKKIMAVLQDVMTRIIKPTIR